jgi:hypothetical protein
MELAGARATCRACMTADRGGARLSTKHGVILRGEGRATLTGTTARVTVDHRRATWWTGDELSSIRT